MYLTCKIFFFKKSDVRTSKTTGATLRRQRAAPERTRHSARAKRGSSSPPAASSRGSRSPHQTNHCSAHTGPGTSRGEGLSGRAGVTPAAPHPSRLPSAAQPSPRPSPGTRRSAVPAAGWNPSPGDRRRELRTPLPSPRGSAWQAPSQQSNFYYLRPHLGAST